MSAKRETPSEAGSSTLGVDNTQDASSKVEAQARRALRPRETSKLVVAPLAVTDLNCPAVIGVEPRVYRDWLVAAGVPFTRIGRRVIARADHVLAALAGDARPTATATAIVDEQPATQDEVLAAIGLARSREASADSRFRLLPWRQPLRSFEP